MAAPAAGQAVYHDETLATHLVHYGNLRQQGYRLVSVDVAGDLGDQRWAAVWEPDTGPAWIGVFGQNSSNFLAWRAARLQEGYRDEWVTSAGDGTGRVYGAVMVRDGLRSVASFDATASGLESLVDVWGGTGDHDNRYLMTSLSAHGTAAQPRYAVVFVENPGNVRWGYTKDLSPADHQVELDAYTQTCWSRLALIAASPAQRYLSIYRDDQFGDIGAVQGLTKSQYEFRAAELSGMGYRPTQITVAGRGSAARYAGLFRRGGVTPLAATATGVEVPVFSAIDDLMTGGRNPPGWMAQNNANEAGIAIAKNGRLVFARGYTFGPIGHPVTQPTSGFRIASLSKSIAAIATFHRIQRSALTTDSRLVDLVSLGTPADPRVNDIRVHHLINHTSGYNGSWPYTVTDKLTYARQDLGTNQLASVPGAVVDYSNAAYQLLSLALEQQAGQSYWSYVRDQILQPLGITRAHLITSSPQAGDVRCQEGAWSTARQLRIAANFAQPGNPLMNRAYAVEERSMDGSGGLVMSPVDYVRAIAGVFDPSVDTDVLNRASHLALRTMIESSSDSGGWDSSAQRTFQGKVIRTYKKGGLWRSAHALGVYRTDGVAIAVFCTRSHGNTILDAVQAVVDQVTLDGAWPSHDLFPAYGLPSYPRRYPGTVTSFGTGCGDGGPVLAHASAGLPEIGFTQVLQMSEGGLANQAFLFVGSSRLFFGSLRLPLDLGLLGAPGCRLYTDSILTIPVSVSRSGTAAVSIFHPDDPVLIGATFHTQYALWKPGANALGLLWSNGLTTTLGR